MISHKPFHKLVVWQRAHQFVLDVYKETKRFPQDELYGVVVQLRRASVSVAANIVEGQAKASKKDFLRYLMISSRSLAECEYYLELSRDLGFINGEKFDQLEQTRVEVGFLLHQFVNSVRRSLTKPL